MFYDPIEENQRRLPWFVRGNRHAAFSRRVWEFQKGLPGEIRAGPGSLLQRARFELGRSLEKDRSRAEVAHRHGHASDDRERNKGRHISGEQKVRKSEQPASRRIRPNPTNELHYILWCEWPLWMGNEPPHAEEKLSLETCDADKRADNEDEVKFEERLDTGGGPRIPRILAWRPQWIPTGAGKEGDKTWSDVGIPAAAYDWPWFSHAKDREVGGR